MKTKRILLSVFAVLLFVVMLGGAIAVGYDAFVNELGNRVVIDKDNNLPVVKPSKGSANVETENGMTTSEVTLEATGVTAIIPEGTKLDDGVNKVTLSVKPIENSNANITLEANEEKVSYDVHIEGVSKDNTAPIEIYVKEMLPKGLNMGNYKLYHVENGETVEMTLLADGEAPVHNSFDYDTVTGDVNLYLASFSEVAVVADTENAWEGTVAEKFADGTGTEADPYIIANADQLAYLNDCVSNDNENYGSKYYKLIADINLGGDKQVFYPIGYHKLGEGTNKAEETVWYTYGGAFSGTFDGNGNTIKNIYQNTWSMDGDYDNGYWDAAMGIFGYVNGGTIKNLTVDNFSSDGEFTPTGVIAAYAVNSTFANIAITNCNPRVYNTGNGGIVGIGGNSSDTSDLSLNFTNITVDNTNKISALWGSWDVACGGLMGMFRGNGEVNFTNCHVAAQIDVNNDVCANYQYYAYRYAGMMIGSIRKNLPADANGHVYPDMTGISASGCTVHFGDWNDYYYCELVANSIASYTHDHQFSRLTQVDAVDVEKMTITVDGVTTAIPTSGRYNYVVVTGDHATENATCYHFVNGEVHNHNDYNGDGVYDYETVNGQSQLVENNQHIYLEFNQLFTGYGWGVTSKGLTDFDGIDNMDIQHSDQEESVVKFDKVETAKDSYVTNTTITVGSLFAANGANINNSGVWVTIEKVDENSNASGKFTANTDDWTQGTIEFEGLGKLRITIQDYNYCTPTTIEVSVELPEFQNKFTGDFLYRVGNGNAVKLDSLFSVKDNLTLNSLCVNVTVESIDENVSVSGAYTTNASDWTQASIKFANTGVVKVTIKYGDYDETKLSLYLEVVDATNVTSATAGRDKNFVLLQDVTFSSTYLYYKNATLYGNGFEIDITGADHSDLNDVSDTNSNKSAYCNIWLVDSRFDNVKITGSVYPEVGMTADSDYGNAAIRTEGDCYITNSYISNCRVPLRVQGNTTLVNSVVDGGRYANIELRSGKLTLDGVTTINTVRKGTDDTTDVIGFGIVIHSEAANASISVIGDGLKQYNWVGENKHKTTLSGDTYLSQAYNLIFNASNNDTIYFDYDSDRYVNTGILCLCADITTDAVTGLDDRYVQTIDNYNSWVLTYDNSKHTDWFNESVTIETIEKVGLVPAQYPVLPEYTGAGAQTVEFTKGETYYFDTSVLTAEKFGQSLEISNVVMNGKEYNYGDKIPLTEGGVFEVVYTVIDPYNYDANASSSETKHTVTITVTAVVKDAEILAPKFTFIDQNGNKYESTTVKVGDKTYVMPNVTAADSTTNSMSSINIGSALIDGTTVYFPIATGYTVRSGSNFNRYYPLFNGINITDYTIAGDTTGTTYTTSGNYTSLVGSSGTKFIIPANGGQTNCGDYVKTDGQAGNAAGNSDSGWQGAGYSTSYGGTYLKSGNTNASRGADSNGYERIVWVEYCFNAGNGDVFYYRIGYHCNKESAQSCVTPDTLVTMADGTQKRIDEVTYDDMILVWDFFNGEYTAVPSMIIMNHGYDNYTIVALTFDDGTVVKTINGHGFYEADSNKFVILSDNNASDYIGHSFVTADGTTTKLVSYTVTEEYTESWSILTAVNYNCILNGMLTITPAEVEGSPDYLMPFEVNDDMKYDEAKMQEDIEKYGLYTYDDFSEYMTYEQYTALNLSIFKVSVGKGYITWDDILYLISIHIG